MRKTRKTRKPVRRLTESRLRRIIREEVNRVNRTRRPRRLREAASPDYQEAWWKMDKWMPEDPDVMDEYYEALNGKMRQSLSDIILDNADEERFYDIAGSNATFEGFVDYLIAKA